MKANICSLGKLGGNQRRAQSRRCPLGLASDGAVEVTLIGKAELRGKPCKVALPTGKALQRGTDPQAQPVAGDRRTGCGAEDPAQMMRRDGEVSRQVEQGALRIGGKRLTRLGNERPLRIRRCGTSRSDWTRIVPLERMSDKRDCTLDELVRVIAVSRCREQQPMLEVDVRRGGQRVSREQGLAAPE
jgi:hypothetical protein